MPTNSVRFLADNCQQTSTRIYIEYWLALDGHKNLPTLTHVPASNTYLHRHLHTLTYLHKHFKDFHTDNYLHTHISAQTLICTHISFMHTRYKQHSPSLRAGGREKIYYKVLLRDVAPSRGPRLCRPYKISSHSSIWTNKIINHWLWLEFL